jgi:hypothetical protein
MIGMAIAFAIFGVLVYWLYYIRKGDKTTPRALAMALPGGYCGALPSLGASRWFYLPAVLLMVVFVGMHVALWRDRPAARRPKLTDDQERFRDSEPSS